MANQGPGSFCERSRFFTCSRWTATWRPASMASSPARSACARARWGIRMALGAERGAILRMVLEDILRLLAWGLAAGLAARSEERRVGKEGRSRGSPYH